MNINSHDNKNHFIYNNNTIPVNVLPTTSSSYGAYYRNSNTNSLNNMNRNIYY